MAHVEPDYAGLPVEESIFSSRNDNHSSCFLHILSSFRAETIVPPVSLASSPLVQGRLDVFFPPAPLGTSPDGKSPAMATSGVQVQHLCSSRFVA